MHNNALLILVTLRNSSKLYLLSILLFKFLKVFWAIVLISVFSFFIPFIFKIAYEKVNKLSPEFSLIEKYAYAYCIFKFLALNKTILILIIKFLVDIIDVMNNSLINKQFFEIWIKNMPYFLKSSIKMKINNLSPIDLFLSVSKTRN